MKVLWSHPWEYYRKVGRFDCGVW